MTIATLGLGEAGAAIAADALAQGVRVWAWDPTPGRPVEGVVRADSPEMAVRGASVVLSLNSAAAAVAAAESVADELEPHQIYADLNTAAPTLKRSVAAVVEPSGVLFADVGLMGVVAKQGISTPAAASGRGAQAFADALGPLGMPVEVLGPEPGAAATRRLLRSSFTKGLAAVAIESMRAAEAGGCRDWMEHEIEEILTSADAAVLDRLLVGSERHAARRVTEMESVRALLVELDVEPRVTAAAEAWLRVLAGSDGKD